MRQWTEGVWGGDESVSLQLKEGWLAGLKWYLGEGERMGKWESGKAGKLGRCSVGTAWREKEPEDWQEKRWEAAVESNHTVVPYHPFWIGSSWM